DEVRNEESMKQRSRWVAVLGLLSVSLSALAQSHSPKIIDVHVHYNGEPRVLEELLKKLNAVDGLAFLLTTPKGFPQASNFIREYPNRFIGFGDIQLDDPNVLQEIDRFHAAGFRGLGEISSTQKNYDDRAYWPIYDRADKYHMILLFHTGIVSRPDPAKPANISFDRSRASRLDLIARHWPNLTIIGAHLGNPDYAEAAEIARWNPNLYFDVSGTTLIKKKDDYRFFRSIFWWTGVVSPHTPSNGTSAFEKLVFGSDVFSGDLQEFDRALARYHSMLDACQVPKSAQEEIFSGTMWHILQAQQAQDLTPTKNERSHER
ncbi:MAG TPA: amidohydrolase family protein, partial [Acidobacteriaceae bacterium]|nr:amidohydrolase family protein [Acidobacteriaceae bacterium]